MAEPAPGAGRSTGRREGAGALVREGRETGVEHRASPGGGWNLQSAAPVHAGSLDPFSPAGQPAAVQANRSAGARRFRRAKRAVTGGFPVSDGPLLTDADVASFMASLRKEPQESLIAVVSDGAGTPVAVIRRTAGTTPAAAVKMPICAKGAPRSLPSPYREHRLSVDSPHPVSA